MLRKLLALAITTGVATKLYRNYVSRRGATAVSTEPPVPARRRAGPSPDQA